MPVQSLQEARAGGRLGFGDLLIAAKIADASGRAFADVVAEFRAGKGWGEIAAESHVKVGTLVSSAHRVAAAAQNEAADLKGQEQKAVAQAVSKVNAAAKEGEALVLARITKETGVASPLLLEMREKSKLGMGELFIAAEIAASSGKTFAEVVAEFQAGKGWGEIAAESHVALGAIVSQAETVAAAINSEARSRVARVKRELSKIASALNSVPKKTEDRV
ncbi:MAG: hypothetical protein HY300_03585, partial [Verrucomicrobia bacterium]|nr:hypothetical protein [Verrucomicrobiota bacterium]